MLVLGISLTTEWHHKQARIIVRSFAFLSPVSPVLKTLIQQPPLVRGNIRAMRVTVRDGHKSKRGEFRSQGWSGRLPLTPADDLMTEASKHNRGGRGNTPSFCTANPPCTTFHLKFLTSRVSKKMKGGRSASFKSGGTFNVDLEPPGTNMQRGPRGQVTKYFP